MGFRHLFITGLYVAACVIFMGSNAAAQSLDSPVSATIRATATVVPSLGMTAPEDDQVSLSVGQTFGVRGIDQSASGHDVLSMHRLLVRFPSLSSTLVTVESDSQSIDCFSLAERAGEDHKIDTGEASRPGAMLVDLGSSWKQMSDCDECVIVTLIYTEN